MIRIAVQTIEIVKYSVLYEVGLFLDCVTGDYAGSTYRYDDEKD